MIIPCVKKSDGDGGGGGIDSNCTNNFTINPLTDCVWEICQVIWSSIWLTSVNVENEKKSAVIKSLVRFFRENIANSGRWLNFVRCFNHDHFHLFCVGVLFPFSAILLFNSLRLQFGISFFVLLFFVKKRFKHHFSVNKPHVID